MFDDEPLFGDLSLASSLSESSTIVKREAPVAKDLEDLAGSKNRHGGYYKHGGSKHTGHKSNQLAKKHNSDKSRRNQTGKLVKPHKTSKQHKTSKVHKEIKPHSKPSKHRKRYTDYEYEDDSDDIVEASGDGSGDVSEPTDNSVQPVENISMTCHLNWDSLICTHFQKLVNLFVESKLKDLKFQRSWHIDTMMINLTPRVLRLTWSLMVLLSLTWLTGFYSLFPSLSLIFRCSKLTLKAITELANLGICRSLPGQYYARYAVPDGAQQQG